MRKTDFITFKADSDLWFKDCGTHYEYLARYVNDILPTPPLRTRREDTKPPRKDSRKPMPNHKAKTL